MWKKIILLIFGVGMSFLMGCEALPPLFSAPTPKLSPSLPSTMQGVFLDADMVEGLTYRTDSLSGTTENGVFQYKPGEKITFSVGEVIIGSALGAPIITAASFSPNSPPFSNRALNISRFLQALDSDNDPQNGIHLAEKAITKTQGFSPLFDLSPEQFGDETELSQLMSSLDKALPQATTSRTFLEKALSRKKQANITSLAGKYWGVFTGDDSGNFEIEIQQDGKMTGRGTGENAGSFTIDGEIDDTGKITTGNTNIGTIFSGQFYLDGTIKGGWSNFDEGVLGNFSGVLDNRDGKWAGQYSCATSIFQQCGFTITSNGNVDGSYSPETGSNLTASGSVDPNGKIILSGENNTRFEGQLFTPGGVLSGTWYYSKQTPKQSTTIAWGF